MWVRVPPGALKNKIGEAIMDNIIVSWLFMAGAFVLLPAFSIILIFFIYYINKNKGE